MIIPGKKVIVTPLGRAKGYNAVLETGVCMGEECTYFEQNIPLGVNLTQTITDSSNNLDFIAQGVRGAQGLISTEDSKAHKIFLIILGVAANTYGGANSLDCSDTGDENQWQMDLDGGGWEDLVNGLNLDGQMLDNDWWCPTEGGMQTFAFQFDVTNQVTNIDGKIGISLATSLAKESSLIVTISAFLKILWKL